MIIPGLFLSIPTGESFDNGVTPVSPTSLSNKDVWIDADDYSIGAIANGATITNKGTGGFNFTVSGTGLSVVINAEGRKAFSFDGATWLNSGNQSYFSKFHQASTTHVISFIGKIGDNVNPNAVYGLCGNNGTSASSHGLCMYADNRTSTAEASRGLRHAYTKAAGNFPFTNLTRQLLEYGTRIAYHSGLNLTLGKDHHRSFINGDLVNITDRTRTTNNTTSGLGTVISPSANTSTYNFQIGACGNNISPLVGEIEQFLMISAQFLSVDQVRGLDKYWGFNYVLGKSTIKYITIDQTITDGYMIGGDYHVLPDGRRIAIASKGPNHAGGNANEGVQTIAADENSPFGSFTTNVSDAGSNPHHMTIGQMDDGTGIMVYSKMISGVFSGFRYKTTSDYVTWSSESSAITFPSTSPALVAYATHDTSAVMDNGDVVIPWYGADAVPGTIYNVYALVVGAGPTFTHREVFTSGSEYINEMSVANFGSGSFVMVVRVELAANIASPGTYRHRFFKSTDNCVTWTSLGDDSLAQADTRRYVYPHPPQIRTFMLNGVRVMVFYWVDRGERRLHAVYCTCSEFLAEGVTALNDKDVYHFDVRLFGIAGGGGGYRSGYPVLIHPDNTIAAEGTYFEEIDNDDICTMNFIKISDEHGWKVAEQLGI